MTKQEQKKRAQRNSNAAIWAAHISDTNSNKKQDNKMADVFNEASNDAEEYSPKSSASSLSTKLKSKSNKLPSKSSSINKSFSNTKSKGSKLVKSAKALFNNKKPRKPVKYGNMRVKLHIADELHSLQDITHEKSRSDLLDKMIKLMKDIILTSSARRHAFKRNIKLYQNIRKEKHHKQ